MNWSEHLSWTVLTGRPCCFSSGALFLPALVAFVFELYWSAIVILYCASVSIYYHLDEADPNGLVADLTGCALLGACILFLLRRSRYRDTPINLLAVLLMLAAMYAYIAAGDDTTTQQYMEWHSAWHVLVAYAITCVLYSFHRTTYHPTRTRILAIPIYSKVWEKKLGTEAVVDVEAGERATG